MKVFIADDSEIMREHLKEMLSCYSEIEIIGTADNTGRAVESIGQLRPDLVILDIRMPDGNGIDVLRSVKKRGSLPVIIMFTNYPFPQYRKKCLDTGAEYFFDKSSESDQMIKTIEKLLVDFPPSGSRQLRKV
ncbi:MAG: response regulator transcription factor [Candidatus Glassbacteria bacterium]